MSVCVRVSLYGCCSSCSDVINKDFYCKVIYITFTWEFVTLRSTVNFSRTNKDSFNVYGTCFANHFALAHNSILGLFFYGFVNCINKHYMLDVLLEMDLENLV